MGRLCCFGFLIPWLSHVKLWGKSIGFKVHLNLCLYLHVLDKLVKIRGLVNCLGLVKYAVVSLCVSR